MDFAPKLVWPVSNEAGVESNGGGFLDMQKMHGKMEIHLAFSQCHCRHSAQAPKFRRHPENCYEKVTILCFS